MIRLNDAWCRRINIDIETDLFCSEISLKIRFKSFTTSLTSTSFVIISTLPDSILDRSRISLIRFNRSLPDEWMVERIESAFRSVVIFVVLITPGKG